MFRQFFSLPKTELTKTVSRLSLSLQPPSLMCPLPPSDHVLFFFTNKHRLCLPPAFSTPSTTLPRFFLPRFFLLRFFSIQRYSPPISTIKITIPFHHPPRIKNILHPITSSHRPPPPLLPTTMLLYSGTHLHVPPTPLSTHTTYQFPRISENILLHCTSKKWGRALLAGTKTD